MKRRTILCLLLSGLMVPAFLSASIGSAQTAKASPKQNQGVTNDLDVVAQSERTSEIISKPSDPVLLTPGDYVNTDSVHFSWTPSVGNGSITYDLKIDDVIVNTGLQQASVDITGITDGTHTWSVRASEGESYSNWVPNDDSRFFVKDTVKPILNDEKLIYSYIDATQNPPLISAEAKKIAGRYVVPMGENKFEDVRFNMLIGTTSEKVVEDYIPIFFQNLTDLEKSTLKSYFTAAPYMSDLEIQYYNDAVDGFQPIAFLIFGDQNQAVLIDGCNAAFGGDPIPLVIPGNFPYGIYQFHGEMTDTADNKGDVNFAIEFVHKGMVLPAPTNLVATASDAKVSLVWDSVLGAVSYNVYYKLSTEESYTGPINVLDTSTDLLNLRNGLKYDFKVVAVSSLDDMGAASTISSTPIAPVVPPVVEPVVIPAVTVPTTESITKAQPTRTTTTQNSNNIMAPTASASESTEQMPAIELPTGIAEGAESFPEDSVTESINWTPWIILFMLIILAGAATGGYFYWFAGADNIEGASVATTPDLKRTAPPVEKKTNKPEANTTKSPPKRW